MMYRARSGEKSGRFLKIHVADAPENAAGVKAKLRLADRSFLGRMRRFRGVAPCGADAYWPDRSDAVDAWIHYRLEQGTGAPSLFITGRCADAQWPELLGELEAGIYVAAGEVLGIRRKCSGRAYQEVRNYAFLPQEFFRSILEAYISEAIAPACGLGNHRFMYECAMSRGQRRCRMFAICDAKQSRRLPRVKRGG